MADLVQRARAFAINAHETIQHRRKYTNQPYWVHPQAVATLDVLKRAKDSVMSRQRHSYPAS